MPFSLVTPQIQDTLIMQAGESLSLEYILYNQEGLELIKKTTSFFSDNYLSNHTYHINENPYFVSLGPDPSTSMHRLYKKKLSTFYEIWI